MAALGDALVTVVQALNALSPLGLAAMLAFIIWQLVGKKGNVRKISDNHLSDMPEILATLQRIETGIGDVRDGINYLKGRVNGRSGG